MTNDDAEIRRLVGNALEVEVHEKIPTLTMVKMLVDLLERYRDVVGGYDALDYAEFQNEYGNKDYPGPGKWQ